MRARRRFGGSGLGPLGGLRLLGSLRLGGLRLSCWRFRGFRFGGLWLRGLGRFDWFLGGFIGSA